jgi:hypothetical protein
MIERRYPEPKYRFVKKYSLKDILLFKKCKIIKGEKIGDNSKIEQFIFLRKRGKSLNYDDYMKNEERKRMNDLLNIIKEESAKSSLINQDYKN